MHATNILGQIFCTTIPAYPKVVKSSQERKDADGEMQQTGEVVHKQQRWGRYLPTNAMMYAQPYLLFLHPNKLHVNFDGSAKNQGLRDHCYTLLPFISIYVIPLPLSKSDPAVLGGSKRPEPGQGPQNIDGIEKWCANIGLPIYWTKRKQLLGALSRNRPLTGWHQYL